jgi:hypothetical protein
MVNIKMLKHVETETADGPVHIVQGFDDVAYLRISK